MTRSTHQSNQFNEAAVSVLYHQIHQTENREHTELTTQRVHNNDSTDEEYEGNPPSQEERATIRLMLRQAWGVNNPREFQIRAIHCLVFARGLHIPRLGLLHRTSEGKSLVIVGAATMLRGITLVIEPLVAISADQVTNVSAFSSPRARVYEFYLDSMSEDHVREFGRFLLRLEKCERHSILLYASPDVIKPGSLWHKCIINAKRQKIMSLIANDETQTVYYDGCCFRPSFQDLGSNLYHDLWGEIPMLFASATMNAVCQAFVEKHLRPPGSSDPLFSHCYWGHMRRREITIRLTFPSRSQSH